MDRVLIYCQRQDECAQLYLLFCMRLGENASEPPGALDLPKYRILDMYTSGTHPSVREEIVKAYTSLTSPLHILIATVAFGMGVNPPNVHFVFNYGPPSDTETYLQEDVLTGSRTWRMRWTCDTCCVSVQKGAKQEC